MGTKSSETTNNHHDDNNNDSHATRPCILWSAISRGETLLVEATMREYLWQESIQECAKQLLVKKVTPGWEFVTHSPSPYRIRFPTDHPHVPTLKGMKFHIYEHFQRSSEFEEETEIPSQEQNNKTKNQENDDGLVIWSISAVYDPSTVETAQVQSFIRKMVALTHPFRDMDVKWKYGSTYAAQSQFSSILHQRMSDVTYLGKLCMVNDQIDSLKEIMARNIELILQRGEKMEDLQEKSTELSHMAQIFKKRSKQVKRQMLWQNAKYGLVLGTAISAGVAVIVVPPLVAL